MAKADSSNSNRFLYLLVFTSGMTTLAVELSASRLLGYIFGNGNLVWANIIGLMLLYLTVGYFLGGRWADKSPKRETLYQIVLWGAFLCALVPREKRAQHRAEIERRFAHEIAGQVKKLSGRWKSGLVILAANPKMLGMLRGAVQAVLESGVQLENIRHDYTALTPSALAQQLKLANR